MSAAGCAGQGKPGGESASSSAFLSCSFLRADKKTTETRGRKGWKDTLIAL